jgi:hypothetical protein
LVELADLLKHLFMKQTLGGTSMSTVYMVGCIFVDFNHFVFDMAPEMLPLYQVILGLTSTGLRYGWLMKVGPTRNGKATISLSSYLILLFYFLG